MITETKFTYANAILKLTINGKHTICESVCHTLPDIDGYGYGGGLGCGCGGIMIMKSAHLAIGASMMCGHVLMPDEIIMERVHR